MDASVNLVQCTEEEFDCNVTTMDLQSLVETIAELQEEMAEEQVLFNKLSGQLNQLPESSPHHDQVSSQLMQSQTRLATLMARNMKCFTQKTAYENQELICSSAEGQCTPTRTNLKQTDHIIATPPYAQDKSPSPNHNGEPDDTDSGVDGDIGTNSPVGVFGLPDSEDTMTSVNHNTVSALKHVSDHPPTPRHLTEQSRVPENKKVTTTLKLVSVYSEDTSGKNTQNAANHNFASNGNLPNGTGLVDNKVKQTEANSHKDAAQSRQPPTRRLKVIGQSQGSAAPQADRPAAPKNVIFQSKSKVVSSRKEPVVARETGTIDNKPCSDDTDDKVDSNRLQGVRATAAIFAQMANQQEQPAPTRKLVVRSVKSAGISAPPPQAPSQSAVPRSQSTPVLHAEPDSTQEKAKKVQFAPDTEFHEREKPKPKTPFKNVKLVMEEGEPDEVDVEGEGDEAGLDEVIQVVHTSDGASPERPAKPEREEVGDEPVEERVTLASWNPDKLLQELYHVELHQKEQEYLSYQNKEGYLERLPLNNTGGSLLRTWKRRFFKLEDGCLYCFEPPALDCKGSNKNASNPNSGTKLTMQLGGGSIQTVGETMLGIDDGKGSYLVVRTPPDEYDAWLYALQSQTIDNTETKYVQPVQGGPAHPGRKVIIVDIGSSSIRAGILRGQPSLPDMFFPCVLAHNTTTEETLVGHEAYTQQVRLGTSFIYPVRPSQKVDKYTLDIEAMPLIFHKIFSDLNVKSSQYWVMLSAPGNMNKPMKEQFMNILVKDFNVAGVHIVNQTVLTLYAYSATSGIIVDIGDRLEIVPITSGYVMDGGMARQPYGGQHIAHTLNQILAAKHYQFSTDVDSLLVRHVMEKTCYISKDYTVDKECAKTSPGAFRMTVDLSPYDLPDKSWTHVTLDEARFHSPEGLFNMKLWGMDNPPIHKLVHNAIQACPMDHRKEMCRRIYLSGGATMIPGFRDRLHSELVKLYPPNITIEVHASPHRYHAAYIGASVLAGLPEFQQAGISSQQWKKEGAKALQKWALF